jgi:DNA-binding IclR family transcriptional regulator
MHAVPSGLVFLAEWPATAVDGYVARDLARLTPSTVVDPEQLRSRLEDVRRSGYAWGLEEFAEGINSVATPVRDARGNAVAAIHVHGPAYRFPAQGDTERITTAVVAAGKGVTRLLARDERLARR